MHSFNRGKDMVELRYEIIAQIKNENGLRVKNSVVGRNFIVKTWAQDKVQELEILNPDTEYFIQAVTTVY